MSLCRRGKISSSASASCDFNFDTATSVELPIDVFASSNSSNALDTNLLSTSTFASRFSICSELTAPLDDSATFLRSSAIFSLSFPALSPVLLLIHLGLLRKTEIETICHYFLPLLLFNFSLASTTGSEVSLPSVIPPSRLSTSCCAICCLICACA